MYDQFYGFTGRPFQLTPDARFYFESGTHRKAMSYLGYGLAQGEGFIVITGEIGSGKSTLVAYLMDTIDKSRLNAVKLVSTRVDGEDLLRLVAQQFELPSEGVSKAELIQSIEFSLHDQARQGKRSLLIVDEAQNLTERALEELRMLSNFQLGGHPLLQIFLLGQPEFRDMVQYSPNLEQLRQRVIATHHLTAMEPDEVEPYIVHRLSKVGWTGDPRFVGDAYRAMYDYSQGIPRKLNVLASRVLLLGALESLHEFNGDDVRAVIADMIGEVSDHEDPLDLHVEVAAANDGGNGLLATKQKRSGGPVLAGALSPEDYRVPEEDEYDEEPYEEALYHETGDYVDEAFAVEPFAPEPFEAAPFEPALPHAAEMAEPVHEELDDAEPLALSEVAPEDIPVAEPLAEAAEVEAPEMPEPAPEAEPFTPVAATAPEVTREMLDQQQEEMDAMARQMAELQQRLADQDAALRRMLTLLVNWVETEESGSDMVNAA